MSLFPLALSYVSSNNNNSNNNNKVGEQVGEHQMLDWMNTMFLTKMTIWIMLFNRKVGYSRIWEIWPYINPTSGAYHHITINE